MVTNAPINRVSWRLPALLLALSLGVLFPNVKANAQVQGNSTAESPRTAQAMVTALAQQCNRATEVTYRSERLVSPNGLTTVHVEGILRKLVNPNSQLRQIDTEAFCYPDHRETISR